MCMMCPDFVIDCRSKECGGRALFFLESTLCQHLEEKYGTKNASLLDHVLQGYHDECGVVCDYETWEVADAAEVRRVVLAVEREEIQA
jgi:hypothetical protein